MAHANEDLLRGAYEAFGRGDISELKSRFFAEDVRWHYPGRSPFGGDYDGVDQVGEWLRRTFEACWGSINIEVHDVIANDEHAIALTTVRAQREGRSLQDDTVQVFRITDGKATEVWTYPRDQYASDEFWS
jgi:ketosteroid isomerase-like protein